MKLKFIATFTLIFNVVMLCVPVSGFALEGESTQNSTLIADHTLENQTLPDNNIETQTPAVIPNRSRRTQRAVVANNYLGAGITTSGLAAYSKFSLGDDFSLRPQILFDDLDEDFNGTVVVPVTYDFVSLGSRVSPFIGVGGSTQTREFDVGLNFSSGLDYAISNTFTATGLFNVQLFDDNDINAIFGLGYNF